MSQLAHQTREVQLFQAGATFGQKLDLVSAVLTSIIEAHRDDMSEASWAALHVSKDKISEAILQQNSGRLLRAPTREQLAP